MLNRVLGFILVFLISSHVVYGQVLHWKKAAGLRPSDVLALGCSPDGQISAAVTVDGRFHVYEKEKTGSTTKLEDVRVASNAFATCIAFQDNRSFAVGMDNGSVMVHTIHGGDEQYLLSRGGIVDIAAAAKLHTIATIGGGAFLIGGNGEVLDSINAPAGIHEHVTVEASGPRFAYAANGVVWEKVLGQPVDSVVLNETILAIAYDASQSLIVATSNHAFRLTDAGPEELASTNGANALSASIGNRGSFVLYGGYTGTSTYDLTGATRSFPLPFAHIVGTASDSRIGYVLSGIMLQYLDSTGATASMWGAASTISGVLISPDSNSVVTYDGISQTLSSRSLQTGDVQWYKSYDLFPQAGHLEWDSIRSSIAAPLMPDAVGFFDAFDGSLIDSVVRTGLKSFTVARNMLVVASSDSIIKFVEVMTHEQSSSFKSGFVPTMMKASESGGFIAIAEAQQFAIYSIEGATIVAPKYSWASPIRSIDFCDHDSTVLLGADQGLTRLNIFTGISSTESRPGIADCYSEVVAVGFDSTLYAASSRHSGSIHLDGEATAIYNAGYAVAVGNYDGGIALVDISDIVSVGRVSSSYSIRIEVENHSLGVYTDKQHQPIRLAIFDVGGRLVKERHFIGSSEDIFLGDLSSGAYKCLVVAEDGERNSLGFVVTK